MLSPEKYIKQKARTLPIYECWVNSEWAEDGLANITVARQHTGGNFTLGLYLIDTKCLGVKDANYFFNMSPVEYREFLDHQREAMDIENIDYKLAHNIIFAGLEYADDYDFKPHPDFAVAKYILEDDTDDIELIEIGCGDDEGNPIYVRGPLDNNVRAAEIIAHLEKTAGPDNFTFIDGREGTEWENEHFDEDYDVDEDDWERFEALEELSPKEKLEKLLDYLQRMEELSDEEGQEMLEITELVIEENMDEEKSERYYGKFSEHFDKLEITENAFAEMFAGLGIEADRIDEFNTDFDQTQKLIDEGDKKAKKKLAAILKDYPENAASCFLELYYLFSTKSKKYQAVLENAINNYPTYPLIGLLWRINQILVKEKETKDVYIRNALEIFFDDRTTLHILEVYYLFFYLAIQAAQTKNIEQLHALYILSNESELYEDEIEVLMEIITTGKLAFVLTLMKKHGLG